MNSIRWEDMVFANRNQSYGAYALRKAYSRRVTMAFALAMSVTMMLLGYPMVSRLFEMDEPVIAEGKRIDYNMLQPPPSIEEIIKPPVNINIPPPIEQLKFVQPRVTDQQVVDDIPTIDDLQNVQVSDQTTEGDVVIFDDAAIIETIAPEVEDATKIHLYVEQPPEFPGGMAEMMKFVAKNIKYPSTARRMNIEGSVFISFVVNADGTIDDIETIKGVFADCDAEAMRVIGKMPLWKPGKQNGKAVRVKFVLPVKFKLGD